MDRLERDCSIQPSDKIHPTPRHPAQVAFRSAPTPLQDGHSFQSESLIALRFVPLHRSPLMVFPQRRLMRVGLYPAFPHSVQDATGTGRLFASVTGSRTTVSRFQKGRAEGRGPCSPAGISPEWAQESLLPTARR
jgi:hypothetical protein